jgi:hypothetical protein
MASTPLRAHLRGPAPGARRRGGARLRRARAAARTRTRGPLRVLSAPRHRMLCWTKGLFDDQQGGIQLLEVRPRDLRVSFMGFET